MIQYVGAAVHGTEYLATRGSDNATIHSIVIFVLRILILS